MAASNSIPKNKLIDTIREAVIGKDHALSGPFGLRRVTYADYTASGRSLGFIESFIRDHVMPFYANTHTESSGTGLQTTCFREEARGIIHRAVGGNEEDVVIFTGSGATGAIHKLITILNLRIPADLNLKYQFLDQIPTEERPVIFIGPYEHHSNEIPWRESIADVVVIDEDENGRPDQSLLVEELKRYSHRPIKIGSFSAASNVTGIGSATREISKILHRHGALAFWDFAAAGPYVQIDMNLVCEDPDDYKDAIFLSPHKFIGGPGTPGVLVVKRRLLKNRVPSVPGGGTVAYVGPTEHRFIDDPIHREEGGTPSIIGAIRAGLIFQLKESVSVDTIRNKEDALIGRAVQSWSQNPNIQILGNPKAWRLSIVSFMVRYGAQYLHHNFVVALLNDLFGIQARGGCSCAGPYGHRLLGISITRSKAFEREIMKGCEGIKPGWTRVNFNYFISDILFEFIISAVHFVANEGWKFLPSYRFVPDTGQWIYSEGGLKAGMHLSDISYEDAQLKFPHTHAIHSEDQLNRYLEEAHSYAQELGSKPPDPPATEELRADFESLRWFPLPHEVARKKG